MSIRGRMGRSIRQRRRNQSWQLRRHKRQLLSTCMKSSRQRPDKKLYKLGKARERRARDLIQMKSIKDENDEGDLEHSESRGYFEYCMCIKSTEDKWTIRRMRKGRATGPDEIAVKFWKNTSEGYQTTEPYYGSLGKGGRDEDEDEEGDRKRDLHMVFIDLKKAHDKVPRVVLWRCLMSIGVHVWSTLRLFLFVLMLDELTRHIQGEVSWCMLSADGIVLMDKMRIRVNNRLEVLRETLESKGSKLSSTETKYLECKFSDTTHEVDMGVKIDKEVIPKGGNLKYPRLIIEGNRRLTSKGGRRLALEVLCDKSATPRLEEMIRNEVIRGMVGVASVAYKLTRSDWFRHLKRCTDAPIRRCEKFVVVNFRRDKGRPKKNYREVIYHDMTHFQFTKDMNLDRKAWRSTIRIKG
ncbi:hypothetical protein H5410_025769 [Solanum commersonii]|uniref:Reverse transcriptase domain-containing protein n=1 Tax=Solanum commersonii TaxID=4109 RepID=A0A9J5YWT2_SOLCO|nr:hypothetical protein H5410_025769 [Solanum commersonii]